MTRIKCLDTFSTVEANYLKGREYDVLDALAHSLVTGKLASKVDTKPKTPKVEAEVKK